MKNYYDEVGKPWMPCYDEKQKSITKITEGHIRRGAFKNNDIFETAKWSTIDSI